MALTGQRIQGSQRQAVGINFENQHNQNEQFQLNVVPNKIRNRISLDLVHQNSAQVPQSNVFSPRQQEMLENSANDGLLGQRIAVRQNQLPGLQDYSTSGLVLSSQVVNTNGAAAYTSNGQPEKPKQQYHYIYDYLFVQVSNNQFLKEYEPKLNLRESDTYRTLIDSELGLHHRALSPQSATAQTYMGQGSQFAQKELEKKGQAIQNLLAAAERRQQARTGGKGSALQSPTGSRGEEEENGQQNERIPKEFQLPDGSYAPVQNPHEGFLNQDQNNLGSLPELTTTEKLSAVLMETQFDGLKVLKSEKVTALMDYINRQELLSSENNDEQEGENHEQHQQTLQNNGEKNMTTFIKKMSDSLTEQNKRFKLTVKKKYVNEILLQSKGAQNLAQCVILIVCDSALTNGQTYQQTMVRRRERTTSKQPRGASNRRNDQGHISCSSGSDGDDDYERRGLSGGVNPNHLKALSLRQQSRRRMGIDGINSAVGPDGKQTPQDFSKKQSQQNSNTKRAQGGYDSESDAIGPKSSLNSTTTSSTMPQFLGGALQNKEKKMSGMAVNNNSQGTGGGLSTPKQSKNIQQPVLGNAKLANRSLSYIGAGTNSTQRKETSGSGAGNYENRGANARGESGNLRPSGDSTVDLQELSNQQRELTHVEIKMLMDQRAQANKPKRYAQTKIKIMDNVDAYYHHFAHPINCMIRDYNDFGRLVFKAMTQRDRAPKIDDIAYAIRLAKRLGLNINKNHLSVQFLKVRENANAIKEKLIQFICKVMQRENDYEDTYVGSEIFKKSVNLENRNYMGTLSKRQEDWQSGKQNNHYKFYVGKGNNSMMVRTLLKGRFWWQLHDKEDIEKVNFMWTQLRKNAVMGTFKCKLYKKGEDHGQTSPPSKLKSGGSSLRVNSSNTRRNIRSAHPGHQSTPSNNRLDSSGQEENDQTMSQNQLIPENSNARKDNERSQERGEDNLKPDKKDEKSYPNQVCYPIKIYNKLEDNYHLANKKALFVNMKTYYEAVGEDPFQSLPVTFHVKQGLHDAEFSKFKQYYEAQKEKGENQKNKPANIWIIKPGENTNRGIGIQVASDYDQIEELVANSTQSSKRTCIVQKYIHNPLLIHKRKFDIRTYAMLTSVNGNLKGYTYEEGYLRTACYEYSIKNLSNRMVHLTNDAIQKKSEDYGKFEPGNKMGYEEFQRYLDKNYGSLNICFERDILPQIKKLTADCFRAVWGKIDPHKRMNTFECYGLDFMIDEEFQVFIIEVNTNPCLELSSPLLARLIPAMLENALRLVVDPLFPPPDNFSQRKQVVNELCPENKFELVFDERIDGPHLAEILREKENIIVEIDEEELSDADNEENNKNNRLCEEDLLQAGLE